jgi:hypothetical protein
MPKYVSDTSAGKAISAWVILRGSREVATIRVFYGNSCLVNVFQGTEAVARCAKAVKMTTEGRAAYDRFGFQRASAGGYGYDKLTAALSDLMIDGHLLTDYCGASKKRPASGAWPYKTKAPRGYRFANYSEEAGGYTDCYRIQGLDYLKAIGYRVLQAI